MIISRIGTEFGISPQFQGAGGIVATAFREINGGWCGILFCFESAGAVQSGLSVRVLSKSSQAEVFNSSQETW